MRHCREIGALYIDTVVEPWPGFYYDKSLGNEARTNYALRETVQAERRKAPGGVTAVSCCGANPGMVSWFVKQALVNLARDLGDKGSAPKSKEEWARLAERLGVKGVHIAERDTQRAKSPKPRNVFVNTWSVEGFLSEGMQPAELGWGTHEKWTPPNAGFHESGCGAAIYINQPGANTRVRSWTPTARAQFGFLVTHNESISIADYYTVRDRGGEAVYRPTCHYAYHPVRRRGAVAARAVRPRRRDPERASHLERSRNSRRDRRTRRAPLRPRPQRLLVWLAALGRGDARARAAAERDRPAGHVGGARGHGLGAREPERGHRRSGRNGLPPAASRFRRPISARSSAPIPTGRRSRAALACSQRTSTRAIPGSSGTCWRARGRGPGSVRLGAGNDSAERRAGYADERAQAIGYSGAQGGKAVAIKRRNLRAEIVDDEGRRQHVPAAIGIVWAVHFRFLASVFWFWRSRQRRWNVEQIGCRPRISMRTLIVN